MNELRDVDANLLVLLDALLGERSITRAAELVGVTQQTASSGLARLRDLIGDELLVRAGRAFELTDRAEELVPMVRAALVEVDRTFNMIPGFDPGSSDRRFRITASDYVLGVLTAPLLSLLADEAPGVSVEFGSLSTIDPVSLLRRDVVIASTRRGVPGKRQSLFSDTFSCVVRRDHPRLVDGALTVEDLAELTYVEAIFSDQVSMLTNEILAAGNIEPASKVSVPGFLTVPFLVSGTDLYGFIPTRLLAQYGEQLDLVEARIPLPGVTLVEAAYWHPSKSKDPALRWLVGVLRRAAEIVEFSELNEEETSPITEG